MKPLFLALPIIFISLISHADESSKKTAIKLLMDKSGIERQLSQVPQQLMQSVQQKAAQSAAKNGPNLVFAALAEAIQHAYNIDIIKEEITNTLNTHLTDDEVINILQWFASEYGQEITKQELKTSLSGTTPAGRSDMNAFMERLKMVEPEISRMNMIKKLDKAIHATDFMIDTTLNTTTAFMKAMQKTLPEEAQKQMDDANMAQQIDAQRNSLKPVFTQVVENTLLYTYNETSDETLSAYVDFCNSADGNKFYKTSFLALKVALNKANQEMANYFANKIRLDTPNIPSSTPLNIPAFN